MRWAPPLYFLYYAAGAALIPFLTVYYQDLGLRGAQIGFLAGLPALVSLVSAPVWGAVSDLTRRHRLALLLAIGGAIVMALSLSALRSFALLVPVVIGYAFFSAPIMPLVDSTTMTLLGGQKERYGRIRLWGALGWGVAAPLIGWLTEHSSGQWPFWSYAALMGLGLVVALGVPVAGRIGEAQGRGLSVFLHSPRWLTFLAAAFCGGLTLAMISSFLFLYLRELGAGNMTLGLALTFATVSELPVLFFSNRLLRRWPAGRLMAAAILFFALRSLALSVIRSPGPALWVQLLHGPSFSLMWIAGVSYADQIAPPGLDATAQGLFSGVMLGIGSAAGSFLGGLLYESVGLASTFQVAALIALGAAGILLWMERRNGERTL